MPIAFLPFSIDRRLHGTAAPGTREAQTTRGLFATQKGITACYRSAAGAGEATAAERVRSIGVSILMDASPMRCIKAAHFRNRFSGFARQENC